MGRENTIELKYENEDGDEVVLELPSKMEVCDDCEGHGFVLRASIRDIAYTREEFEECFPEDEDKEAYFGHGGKYDEQCPTCKGANVVPVVDVEKLSEDQKKQYEEYQEYDERMAQLDADFAAEREAERRFGC